jgi:hypothetical protein
MKIVQDVNSFRCRYGMRVRLACLANAGGNIKISRYVSDTDSNIQVIVNLGLYYHAIHV